MTLTSNLVKEYSMKEKIIEYGTEHEVEIMGANEIIISAVAPGINEGFLLMYHGMEKLPHAGDKGKIIFERDTRKGHWQFYPDKK